MPRSWATALADTATHTSWSRTTAHREIPATSAGGPTTSPGWWAYKIVDSVLVDNASGGLYAPADATVSFRHNDFADAGAKLLDLGGTIWYAEDLAELEAAGLGRGSISANSRLGDCWLPPAASPLVDIGETVLGLDRDLWGAPRVVGAGPDIGPVERGAGPSGSPAPACDYLGRQGSS